MLKHGWTEQRWTCCHWSMNWSYWAVLAVWLKAPIHLQNKSTLNWSVYFELCHPNPNPHTLHMKKCIINSMSLIVKEQGGTESVCTCWCHCSGKRQAIEGEGENSHANKGILSVPEAAWAATSLPSLLLHPLRPFLSGFIILCLYLLGCSMGFTSLISCHGWI